MNVMAWSFDDMVRTSNEFIAKVLADQEREREEHGYNETGTR